MTSLTAGEGRKGTTMQKITDDQFIQSVRNAVCDKGSDHVAPGSYWRENYSGTGEAYCIVGYALAKIDEDLCPRDNRYLANDLLARFGCSERVALAGFALQYTNDMHMPWGVALIAFEWALGHYTPGARREDVARAAYQHAMRHSLPVVDPRVRPMETYATGGYVTTSSSSIVVQSFADITKSATAASKALMEFSFAWDTPTLTTLCGQPVLVKKDHALTA